MDDPGIDSTALFIAGGADVSGVRAKVIDNWNLGADNFPKAEYVELSGVADLQHSELVRAIEGGENHVDIVLLDIEWIAEFAHRELIVRLDEGNLDTPAGDFFDASWNAGTFRDRLYAVPFNADAGLLYYRGDLVDSPADWEHLIDEARSVINHHEGTGGFVTQLANYEGLSINALESIWAVDKEARLVGDGGDLRLGDAVREGLARLIDASGEGIIPGQATGYREAQCLDAFKGILEPTPANLKNGVTFMRHWPYAIYSIKNGRSEVDPASVVPVNLPWTSVLGGQSLAIARNAANRDAAYRLINFFTKPDQQEILLSAGGLPAALEHGIYDRGPQGYRAMVGTAITRANPRPITPYYNRFSRALRDNVAGWLRVNSIPRRGFDDLRDDLSTALGN